MIKHIFEPQGTTDLSVLLLHLRDTFDNLVTAIAKALPTFVTFVASGANPGTSKIVTLDPVIDIAGNVLRRAVPGARVVAAFNLTDETDAQTLFAAEIVISDQIIQLSTANLSAKKIAFILAS